MAFNVPTYETERFSFGPGIVYMGPAGSTPSVDVGAVKGDAELIIQRERLEVFQGSPQSLVKSYAVREIVSLRFTSIEWDLDNIAYSLGAGVTSVNGPIETLEFGGDIDTTQRAIRFVHIKPDGGTIDLHIFNAEGNGDLTIALKEQDIHEIPIQWNALEGTVDFSNVALADNKKKFKIIHTRI